MESSRGLLGHVGRAAAKISDAVIGDPSNLDAILRTIIEQACIVTGADYGALGIGTDPARPFEPWVFHGMPHSTVEAVGHFPRPVGVLGAVAVRGQAILAEDLRKHREFRGLPEAHPDIGPFLGVPIRRPERSFGNLYLARKPGREPFTDDDRVAIELLASHAAICVENARLVQTAHEDLRAREDLLAIVAHDLRNPLGVISGRVGLILRTASSEELEGMRRPLEAIERAAGRMERLIRDLLDAARIEAGHLVVERRPERLGPIVEEAIETFRPLCSDKGLDLRANLPPEIPEVLCDRERVLQALANLLGNALKFTPSGGVITLEARPSADGALLSVTDTGPGIAAADLPHLFDRFWKARQAGQQGTGLGLYIVKGIVEAHGGHVRIESEPGKGSAFRLTLPFSGSDR
ncbi:MAG: GAF domain-containing sensor histidine kinase [Deltaproteobacteria bacterium]|nr:GAF domain-containing sensor histidine kinase [Deltaproteobacteria bacterium]